ncbi:MAG TPA: DUF1153 domain-containing protein [Allosphingosinicella sp.]|nr:DUF1153 domain-containing protein [Allosphingosinicella sp.]
MTRRRPSRTAVVQANRIRAVPIPTLPPAGTRRWIARRKAQVVEAVLSGMIRLDEALRRYDLSIEEFSLWKRRFYRNGVDGLRMGLRLRHD